MVEATLGTARFYSRSGPYSLALVASVAPGVADELELLLEGVAPLQTARPNEVSFLDNRRYASALEQTSAGAVPSMVLMSRMSLLGHGRPCRAGRRCDGFTPESGPAGGGPSLRPWANNRRQSTDQSAIALYLCNVSENPSVTAADPRRYFLVLQFQV